MANAPGTNGTAMDWRLIALVAAWLAGGDARETFHQDLRPSLGY
jgi:hypothetical protein